jgi:hypothetical protein
MKPRTLVVWGLLGLASLAVAVILAYLTRWQTAIVGVLPLLSGLAGFVLVLMTLLAWGLAKVRKAGGLRRTGQSLLMAGFFLLFQLAYLPVARALRQQEVARAQAFVEALVPRIEVYQGEQGMYPATVEVILTDDLALPALLRLQGDLPVPFNNRDFYFLSGPTYGFRFYLPDGFIGYSYAYCCGLHGQWTVTD